MAPVLFGHRLNNSQTDGSPRTEEESSQSSRLKRKEILILIACCCASAFMHMGLSTIPLLLPTEINKKQIPYQYTGMIFSIFAISIVIFEPLQAKILPIIGTKVAFCCSTFLGGICYLCFAMLEFASKTASFVASAMIIRFFEGFYYAMLITANNVTVCMAFPDRASFGFSILEGFVGAGFTLGPILGGTLYSYCGFIAPFFTIGVLLLVTSALGYFALEQHTGLNLTVKPKQRQKLIKDPAFIGCALLVFAMGTCWGIFETAVEPHLASYEQSAVIEGVVFALAYLSYGGMAPVWGFVIRKVHVDYRWILLGPVAVGIWWMILGPIPVLSVIESKLWLDTICLVLVNGSVAFVTVLSYDTMLKRAFAHGLEEGVATYAMVLAGFFTSLFLGEVVGPEIGGIISSKYSFSIVAIAASSVAFLMTVIAALTMLINWEKPISWIRTKLHHVYPSWFSAPTSGNGSENDESCEDENSPLLQSSARRQNGFFSTSIGAKDGAFT